MTIPGKDFADALFAVWLGPNPVEVALKRALLGGGIEEKRQRTTMGPRKLTRTATK